MPKIKTARPRTYLYQRGKLCQPIAVRRQGKYISLRQQDSAGEDTHWIVIPEGQLQALIVEMVQVAAMPSDLVE